MTIARSIQNMRRDYTGEELSESSVHPDPMKQFEGWIGEAMKAELPDPHAMVLATISADGTPSARVVLLRGLDSNGFTFFTNYGSRKAKEVEAHPAAALVFYWDGLDRQVRVEGQVSKVDALESDRYFASRPRLSQIAAWASNQSHYLSGRDELQMKFREYEDQFQGRMVPRPQNWGGFKLRPEKIEFWQGRMNRLHDRILYTKIRDDSWKITRLAP